jgi:hypothetical protein
MENIKTYKWPDLKRIAASQGYKLAALESPRGEKIASFNQLKVKINTHLDKLQTRMSGEIFPDGVYTVLMAQAINKSATPDRYPIVKGKVSPEAIAETVRNIPLTPAIVYERPPDVLTYDKALEYVQTISDLKNQLTIAEMEITALKKEIAELESEQEEALSEGPTLGGLQSFIKEGLPSLMPALDRYFDIEEKKLNLEEMKLQKNPAEKKSSGTKKVEIVPGTQEQLDLIEYYFKADNEVKLNQELDKLEEVNPELYSQVLSRLGLSEEPEEETE